jgi:D-alanine-D-alanine ligase
MNIGIAYTLAPSLPCARDGGPVDRYEECDSPETVHAVADALLGLGHRPRLLGGGAEFLRAVLADPPELIFNMAEGAGTRAREAHVPAVAEMLGIPYTHSDPLTLAAALDKVIAKRLVTSHGLRSPAFAVVDHAGARVDLRFPVIAKPVAEGSSMGLSRTARVDDAVALNAEIDRLLEDYAQPVLIEEFCPGAEFTVGVLGTGDGAAVLGVMEIVPRGQAEAEFVYSIEAKRAGPDGADFHVPPDRPGELVARVADLALAAHRALGCRDVARIDVRVDGDGEPAFLEANPLPGMKPGWSDLVVLAERLGRPYPALVGAIVDGACARLGL